MGNIYEMPKQVEEIPKNHNAYTFDIEYCSSWGGRPEADFCHKLLQIVYPKSKFNLYTPGYTKNLIVFANKTELFNKKKYNMELYSKTAMKFLERVGNVVQNIIIWVQKILNFKKESLMTFLEKT